ncbi:DNA-directed RNA polymerase subunit H {ECO:0000255/HAMAP-Rule:MF_00025} [Methanothermobacter wolfeii]|nr:DNA-directed RNA polymerase subunit H {ECO:0000255/HAMAP-Rule:MF_00025} [Methanothermobacter wolfeii]
MKHQLVPEHVVLNDSEAKRVLKELDVHPEQLPKIKTTDPVVKAIGAKRGDIVKIIRRSATAEEFITYRLVQD